MSQKQFMIVNEATGLVLDVNSSGDNVIMWAAHGGPNQRFTRDGPYIRAVHSGKVLDVSRQEGYSYFPRSRFSPSSRAGC